MSQTARESWFGPRLYGYPIPRQRSRVKVRAERSHIHADPPPTPFSRLGPISRIWFPPSHTRSVKSAFSVIRTAGRADFTCPTRRIFAPGWKLFSREWRAREVTLPCTGGEVFVGNDSCHPWQFAFQAIARAGPGEAWPRRRFSSAAVASRLRADAVARAGGRRPSTRSRTSSSPELSPGREVRGGRADSGRQAAFELGWRVYVRKARGRT